MSTNTLADRLIKCLTINEDRALTADDIASQFDVARAGVHTALYAALTARTAKLGRLLDWTDDGDSVYYLVDGAWHKQFVRANDASNKATKLAAAVPAVQAHNPFALPGALPTSAVAAADKPRKKAQKQKQQWVGRPLSTLPEVVLEDDVPLGVYAQRVKPVDLTPIFRDMKTGQSCVLSACHAVRRNITAFNKSGHGRLTSRLLDGGAEVRVWRTD